MSTTSRRDAAILAGYASGQSIAYLGALAITMILQLDGYDTISHSNPGFLFFAFAYGAFMNIKTLPWVREKTTPPIPS